MNRWIVVGIAALAAAATVAAEWQRHPGAILAAGLGLLALTTGLAARRRWLVRRDTAARALVFGAASSALLALAAAADTWELHQLAVNWPSRREAAIAAASGHLEGELRWAAARSDALAESALPLLDSSAQAAFAGLARLLDGDGPTMAVALFDGAGRRHAWAGPHRAAIGPDGPALEAFTTGFYVWLVARRQTSAGVAVATLLLYRRAAVPQIGTALADRFAAATGVGLRLLASGEAPPGPDVFDYLSPSGDTLFAVVTVPPEQAAARNERLSAARVRSLLLAALALLAAAVVAARSALPFAVSLVPLVAALVVVARAPLAEAFGSGSLFWPDTYFADILGPFSASAGHLALTGMLAALLAFAIWRRAPRVPLPVRALAMASAFAAPYLLQDLARGITPPAGGVGLALWVTWQLAMAQAATALVLLAAALARGPGTPPRAGRLPFVAGAVALLLAALGLWLWDPRDAWPEWYPYLWVPALMIAIRPMPIRSAVATIAVVSGSAAALLTWGAAAEGRMSLAARDLEGLGDRADPLAIALLDRFARDFPASTPPRNAGDLYVLWRRSALGAQGYPSSLAMWEPDLQRIAVRLDLAELDLADADARLVALEARAEGLPVVWPVLRIPGLYGIAALPLSDGRVLTAAVGPRSRVVAPTRLARVLDRQAGEREPPYTVALAPPDPGSAAPAAAVAWSRRGWQVRGERVVSLPDGTRHAHALIDLRGASPLLQRGALLLVLDVAVLILLWLLSELALGNLIPALKEWWPRTRRSLRVRLSVSLALFFVLPTVSFAAWSYLRLEDEFRSARALLLQRTLRDAAAALARDTSDAATAVAAAARQVDAPLLYSVGGVVTAVSDPVLTDLGLVEHLVPSDVHVRLAYGDELEVVAGEPSERALVGYRLLARSGGADPVVLAAPEPLADATLRRREADLGIAVLVAVLLGVVAALVLSSIASRALARPLHSLRQSALAVGAGTPPPAGQQFPGELEPIHAALLQAARDVEKGRHAQRVLAWGEMARQVAHEIKNPLTPIRLGIQHLLRLDREKPGDLSATLRTTGPRLLNEIDRLDSIARAFSRFAAPSAPEVPLEPVDVASVAHDVAQLYGAGGAVLVRVDAPEPEMLRARARRDELSEVLINLCDNACNAGARRITVTARRDAGKVLVEVSDDGRGIPDDVLPRIFEPRFSTTTSGSGLGLAIARRLVESWGGAIAVGSTGPHGTTVRVTLEGE